MFKQYCESISRHVQPGCSGSYLPHTCWWFSEFNAVIQQFRLGGITKRCFDAFQSCFSVLTGKFSISREKFTRRATLQQPIPCARYVQRQNRPQASRNTTESEKYFPHIRNTTSITNSSIGIEVSRIICYKAS